MGDFVMEVIGAVVDAVIEYLRSVWRGSARRMRG